MTTYQDQPWSRRVMRDAADNDDSPRDTSLSPGGGGEPLDYMTQQRGEQGDAQPFRPRRAEHQDDSAPSDQTPARDTPRYRVRDYSPEGRATPSWAPTYTRTPDPYGAGGERLDYRTQRPADASASAAGDDASDGEKQPLTPNALPDPVITQTMTRRELRRLRELQEAAAAGAATLPPPAEVVTPGGPSSVEETPAEPQGDAQQAEAEPWAPARFHGTPDVIVPEPPVEPASLVEESAIEESAVEEPTDAEPPADEAPVDEAPVDESAVDEALAADSEDAAPDAVIAEPEPQTAPVATVRPDISAPGTGASEPTSAFAAAPAREPWRDAPPPVVDDASHESASGSTGGAPDDLDAWVAQVFDADAPSVVHDAGEASAPDGPVALVEPPEPERWTPDEGAGAPGAPSVLESLFTPPAAAERTDHLPAPDTASAPDPLSFLAGPSAADRVDLPAPSAASQSEPADAEATAEAAPADPAEEIVVEEAEQEPAPVDAEPHPVVIPATPLPAEPLPPLHTAPAPSYDGAPSRWSEQADRDDEGEIVASRDILGGHGVVTTNALVLPAIPQPELAGPLTTTGEILITGSIDLPMSLSATGAHPTQLDQSHLDHELDPGDHQVVSTESQPVRAIKAVSTHTSTRGMMTSTKPRGNRNLTILIAVTGGLAVLVAGLLIVGVLTHAFG